MKDLKPSTAIVLFARKANNEACHKSLLLQEERNLKLHKKLLESAKQVALQSAGDFYHLHEGLQVGKTFGERLTNGAKNIFDKGYNHIIFIGGDCPALSRRDVNLAIDLVQRQNLVVGPDNRGGSYLIGISRNNFRSSNFEKLRWNTSNLYADLKQYAEDGEVAFAEMEKKSDLNSSDDVLQNATIFELRIILSSIFNEIFKRPIRTDRISVRRKLSNKDRRGPPVAAIQWLFNP